MPLEGAAEVVGVIVSVGLLVLVLAVLPFCMRSAARHYDQREDDRAAAEAWARQTGGRRDANAWRFGSTARARALRLAAAEGARGAVLCPAGAELRKHIASTARPFSADFRACGPAAAAAAATAAAAAATQAAAAATAAAAGAATAAAVAVAAAAAASNTTPPSAPPSAPPNPKQHDYDPAAAAVAAAVGDTGRTCAICFDEYAENDLVAALPCRHAFHGFCVDQWLVRDASCPVCKRCLDPGARARREAERARAATAARAELGRRWPGGSGGGRRGGQSLEVAAVGPARELTPEEAAEARSAAWRGRRQASWELFFGDGSGGFAAPVVVQPAAVLAARERRRGGGPAPVAPPRPHGPPPALPVVEEEEGAGAAGRDEESQRGAPAAAAPLATARALAQPV